MRLTIALGVVALFVVVVFVVGRVYVGDSAAQGESAEAAPVPSTVIVAAALPAADEAAHAGSTLPTGTQALLAFHTDPADGVAVLLTDVVADEEYVDRFGDRWRSHLEVMIGHTNELLATVGVRLEVASMTRWQSDDATDRLGSLLTAADAATERASGNLLLVITCQDTVKLDGLARDSAGALILRYYHEPVERNANLVAHELGHLLGADHHADEAECDDDDGGDCLMNKSGFTSHEDWCPHHRDEISAFVAAAAA